MSQAVTILIRHAYLISQAPGDASSLLPPPRGRLLQTQFTELKGEHRGIKGRKIEKWTFYPWSMSGSSTDILKYICSNNFKQRKRHHLIFGENVYEHKWNVFSSFPLLVHSYLYRKMQNNIQNVSFQTD